MEEAKMTTTIEYHQLMAINLRLDRLERKLNRIVEFAVDQERERPVPLVPFSRVPVGADFQDDRGSWWTRESHDIATRKFRPAFRRSFGLDDLVRPMYTPPPPVAESPYLTSAVSWDPIGREPAPRGRRAWDRFHQQLALAALCAVARGAAVQRTGWLV
jgi:hypothetical protein